MRSFVIVASVFFCFSAFASYSIHCNGVAKLASKPSSIRFDKTNNVYRFSAKLQDIEYDKFSDWVAMNCPRHIEALLGNGISGKSEKEIKKLQIGDRVYFHFTEYSDKGGAFRSGDITIEKSAR